MTIRRYRLDGARELQVTRASGLAVLAVITGDVCTSGPLAVPEDALDALRSALDDVAGSTGSEAATGREDAATREPRSERGAL